MMDRQAAIGRRTPYERLFHGDSEERSLVSIEEEARRAGLEIWKRDQLTSLASVAVFLERLVPEDAGAEALDQYLDLLYHALSFRAAGCGVLAFEEDAIRSLVDTPPSLESWATRAWRRSFYLELPSNLFWAAVAPGEPPEPVEGMFVTRPADDWKQTDLLLILGMRPGRPGFTVSSVRVDFQDADKSESPVMFDSDIPGADLAELYSLSRVTEVVSLLARLLWYVDTYPNAVRPKEQGAERTAVREGQEAGAMPHYFRVQRVERSRG